jgi:hypothetical protein
MTAKESREIGAVYRSSCRQLAFIDLPPYQT